MRIFTDAFFRLSDLDQASVVDAELRDLEHAAGMVTDPEQERALRRQIQRIVAKAVKYGIYDE